MARDSFSSLTIFPSGPVKETSPVPVAYASSPDCATSILSVFQAIEKPGSAKARETYSPDRGLSSHRTRDAIDQRRVIGPQGHGLFQIVSLRSLEPFRAGLAD